VQPEHAHAKIVESVDPTALDVIIFFPLRIQVARSGPPLECCHTDVRR
jgi:hypothetical protein